MSHQVLARKWRPRDFDSLVGQDIVVRALRHALDHDRLHHAYLLTGTRGVGKTTIARILGKALNCEVGIGSRPCGHCSACSGVDQGRFPDYLEMDAASNRKVEEMTSVLENAAYAPSIGRFKVIVIDEVHMLSSHAFNAMLKTLEEPPPHVVFVLATTDPQKVPVTVLSRCMQFGLRNMNAIEVAGHLSHVLAAESIAFEPPALEAIARAAAGSMRDALSLLDQAIALGAGAVTTDAVREMLGNVDERVVPQLLGLLAASEPTAVVALADAMAQDNTPFGTVLLELARELQRIALAQVDPSVHHELADRIAPEDVQVWYQIAIHGARDLPLAPDERTGFMMVVLRMLAFTAEIQAAGSMGSRRTAMAPAADGKTFGGAAVGTIGGTARDGAAIGGPGSGTATVDFDGNWQALVARLSAGGAMREFLRQSELIGFSGNRFELRVPIPPLAEAALVDRITELLSKSLGAPVRLAVRIGATGSETVAARAGVQRKLREADAAEAIHGDPFVRELIDGFGATIMPESIKPLQGDSR